MHTLQECEKDGLGNESRPGGNSASHSKCRLLSAEEAKRDLEFIGGDKDRQLKQLLTETKIGSVSSWDDIEDEAERLL